MENQLEITEKPVLSKETIKQYICQNASDQEAMLFLELCRKHKLNPFVKEAYLIKYGNTPATMVVAKDTFIARANEFPDYKGFSAGWIVRKDNEAMRVAEPFGDLCGAFCSVHRKDMMDTESVVRLDEYDTGKSKWSSAKWTMIKKVAISQAHREAYPHQFSGLYEKEEMDLVSCQSIHGPKSIQEGTK